MTTRDNYQYNSRAAKSLHQPHRSIRRRVLQQLPAGTVASSLRTISSALPKVSRKVQHRAHDDEHQRHESSRTIVANAAPKVKREEAPLGTAVLPRDLDVQEDAQDEVVQLQPRGQRRDLVDMRA